MYNIYCLQGFNNYYNRVVKQFNSIQNYINYQNDINKQQQSFSGINFNPNDCVNTTQILNWSNKWLPDYFIVEDANTGEFSRWFVMEAVRQRGQQYLFTLRRDLLVDYYDTILDTPCFIEKGILDQSDAFIFNNENMTFNQIKQKETLLKDESKSAWIVGYMSSKDNVDGEGNKQNIISKIQYHLPVDRAYASANQYPYFIYSNLASTNKQTLYETPRNPKICIWIQTGIRSSIYYGTKFAFNENGSQDTGILGSDGYSSEFPYTALSAYERNDNYQCPLGAGTKMIYENSLKTNTTFSKISALKYFKLGYAGKYQDIFDALNVQIQGKNPEAILNENGKTIYFQDTQKYYKIKVNINESAWAEYLPAYNSDLYLKLVDGYNNTIAEYAKDPNLSFQPTWKDFTGIESGPNSFSFSLNFTATSYNIVLEEQPEPSLTYEIQIDNDRWHLNDAPYDMFCIPYSDDLIINNGGVYELTANKELALQTALALGRDYMAANYIYDIQLLPYCPVRDCLKEDGTFDISATNYYFIKSYTEDKDYLTGTNVGVVLFSTTSNFSFNIFESIQITNKKISNECDTWRICSPNYNGLFEFNAAKNDGVDYFNVDCTYKPFNPYIHINPNFKGLYGNDYNDMRGLVCSGEFSLPQATDQWRTYELNNKNYQNIFDRDIQNMEVNNAQARKQDIARIITGTVSGATSGAFAGGMMGGGWGAAAGAIVGGAASLGGGIADYKINERLREEAIDYREDQFGYQLGNVKALPYSLAKTSAFTANNKIWPFLEYYSCTENEKKALQNKIKYNGMTIMRIDFISRFVDTLYEDIDKNYIKGKIIRLEDINCDDFHVASEIANEVFKGAFYEKR